MIKTKFVFAVSLVAMLAVGSAWAYDPADTSSTADTVATEHTVYTDQTPTTGTGIAGVSYVNKAVNKAGASAQAAEDHAAAAGASALAAQKSADEAASSAKSAYDTLAGKQDKLGFTPENVANKLDALPKNLEDLTNENYLSAKAVVSHVNGQLQVVNRQNNELSGKVLALENAVTAEGALQDVVGNADSGLVKDVADLKTSKEAIANKLTSTAATTVSDTNKDTLYPTVGKVQSMINALDVTDAAQTGKYVSAVSEADGKITVTRATLPTIGTSSLTIKNGATNTNIATFGANATAAVTATIPAASATVAGLAKIGVIPSGSVESASYASIWVE